MRRCFLALAICVVACSFGTGCAVSDRQVIDQAEKVHGSLEPAVIHDRILEDYIQELGDRIIRGAQQARGDGLLEYDKEPGDWVFSNAMKFHLVNSKTVNAFTTGGEHMYVYNGLLQAAQSEDELAAVMAHEFAHVYARHVQHGMQTQMTTLIAGAVVGGAAGYALGGEDNKTSAAMTGAGLGAAGGQFVNMGFTRKDENQADELGFMFYSRAGWDPAHFGDFFQRMIDLGYDKTPEMLSDHPSLKNRVEASNQRAKKLPAAARDWRKSPVANKARFEQVKQRAASLGKKLPDDRSLEGSQELLQALPRSCVAPVDPKDAVEARDRLTKRAEQQQKQAKSKK